MRVTMMSVPTEFSGESALFCASLSPWETPMIPMTRPTPAASPIAVTTVRPSVAELVPCVTEREHGACQG